MTMKSKLQVLAGTFLFLAFSLVCSLAQSPGTAAPAPMVFDPTTGQPIVPAPPEWKDPNWKDPEIILTNVSYNGLPVAEIASDLRERFKEEFDILLPEPTSGGNAINKLTGLPLSESTDWRETGVQLQLRNVTASEVFNAMNLLFENDQTPLRWELKVNGHRQIALLRVLIDRNPNYPAPPKEERRVYFVGDLIGDPTNGGMSMDQIIKTVTDVWQMADAGGGKIQFHTDAQLLVVSGSPSQIDFMTQTLGALKEKVELARRAQSPAKTAEPRQPGAGGSPGH
jgi:hypothetical protein